MPTSITDVLKIYPRESLDPDIVCEPPTEIDNFADLGTLSEDLVDLWTNAGECQLHHDSDLGKVVITLLSPAAAAELTERELRFWGVDDARLKTSDIVFGTVVGRPEFLVFDTTTSEFNILLASMFDERKHWPVLGRTIADFLRRYRNAITDIAWKGSIL